MGNIYFLIFLISFSYSYPGYTCDPKPGTPTVTPLGVPRPALKPGRVAWSYSDTACQWDGSGLFWWKSEFNNQSKVDEMLKGVMLSVTGKETLGEAWSALFHNFNLNKYQKNEGYKKGEKIAIKLNLNGYVGYKPNTGINTISPQFLKALMRNLVSHAGVDQRDITLFDPSRWMQEFFWNEPEGIGVEFPHVVCVDAEGGMDYVKPPEVDHETMFYFSNRSVSAWNLTKLPKCLTAAKYYIQVDGFRGHDIAGMTEAGKNLFGAIYRPDVVCECLKGLPGHWCPISLHPFVNITGNHLPPKMAEWWGPRKSQPSYDVLVDLLGHEHTAHGIAQTSKSIPVKYQMKPFNDNWSCSVFASQDFVALDSVSFDFLRSEPAQVWPNDNYLHEAALANDPPSKTVYEPSGERLDVSLGVHEHWNNPDDKQYSRNLGVGNGIELIKTHES